MQPTVLLTFDVEEFDMPLEYGQQISLDQQLHIGSLGLDALKPIIENSCLSCTLFTTATYAINFPEKIRALAQQHEIASHTYYHSQFSNQDLLLSKNKLEEISGKTVTGLRMPRLRKVEMSEVKAAGYLYDSSINPTYLPGKYNNLHLPRTHYSQEKMLRVPASVSANFRIPLFWLAFKNMPYNWYKNLAINALKKDGYLCLYFHPWEFTNAIQTTALPQFTKRFAGPVLVQRLQQLIKDLQPHATFTTMQNYLEQKGLT